MPSFNTLRYANGYYKPSAAVITEEPDPAQAAVAGLDSTNGTVDAYVVKYTSSGQSLWAARISSAASGTDIAYSTHADSNGNIYVTGESASGAEITVFNADGTPFGRIIPNAGGSDMFFAKYNTNGVVQWVARIASTAASDVGYGIASDADGNVYVTGQGGTGAVVTAYNANGTAFATTLANAGFTDVFLVKYNTNGVVQWVARISSTGSDIGYAIDVDSGGNVYVSGTAGGTSPTVVTARSANGTEFSPTFLTGDGDAFIVKYSSAGTVQWLTRITSTATDIGYGIAVDSGGNVYVTGRGGAAVITARNANGTAFATTLASAGAGDVFLVKYNTSGVVQWVARIASTAADIGYGVAVDSAGDVYVTGQTGSGVVTTAYNAAGTAFATTLASVGLTDVFLVKYNTSGAVQWVTRLGSTSSDIGYGIATDSGNNVYLTGQSGPANVFTMFNSNGTTFGTLANTSAATTDAFLVKYDSGGIVQWGQKLASSAADIGRGITVDPFGNIAVVGTYSGMRHSIYGQTLSLFSSMVVSGTSDAFIVKYNTNGSPQWTARIASTGADIAFDTKTDSGGNLYVVGQGGSGAVVTAYNSDGTAFGTTLPNTGGTDAFIVKYNSSGTVQWVARIAAPAQNDNASGVAVDSAGNLYVAGSSGPAVVTAYNSDGTAFGTTLPNAGSSDGWVVKYDTNGAVQWAARIAGAGADGARGVAVDSGGNLYVVGDGANTAYNSDGTAFGTTLPNAGQVDTFIVKYNSAGFVQWIARVIAGTGTERARDITIDPSDNIYVIATASAGTIPYNSNGTSFGVGAAAGTFIVKYNSAGFVQWVARVGYGEKVATDSSGNVYFLGGGGTLYNADGVLFRTLPTADTSGLAYVAKYDTNGVGQWVARSGLPGGTTGGPSLVVQGDVAVDAVGGVYMTGRFGPTTLGGVHGLSITDSTNTTIMRAQFGSFAVIKFNSAGMLVWTQAITSLTSAYGACVSATGDVYVVGQSSSGTMKIFNSDFTPYRVLSSAGGQDAYVVKYSSTMTPRWAALISTAGPDTGFGIALDSTANVYVAVQCGGTSPNAFVTTVYNGDGSVFGTVANAGDREAILVKYNSSGTGQWTARFATGFTDTGRGVATDSAGNVFFVGGCGNQQVVMFNSDGSTFASFAQSGNGDAIVTKYDGSGFGQWYARIASTVAEVAYSAATDSSGNVYVTGIGPFAAGMAIFNANGTQFGTLTGIGQNDVFLVKYDTTGAVQWAAKVGSTAADIGYGTTVDSAGDIYIAGQTGSAATTTAYNADGSAFATTLASLGLTDGFLIKYNTSGVVQWVARMGGTGADIAYGVTTDSSSNVYVTGSFTGTGTFYSSNGAAFATTLTAVETSVDIFLAKYNSAGTVQWVARIGGSQADVGYSIQVNTAGDVYVGGQVGTYINAYNADGTFFGASAPFFSAGGALSVIVKYNSSGVVQWISQSQGAGANAIQNMVLDSSSNLYATGFITNGTFVPGSS